MRRYFFAVTLCALTGVASPQATLTGLVVGVTDGDTLTLLDDSKQQHQIRLAGIDAPESGQPFGNRAKQSLAALAFARRAEVNRPKTDRCGRRVCKVTVGGVDVGLERIRRGMAWHFTRHEKEQSAEDRATYAAAEIEARQAGRGLWRDRMPVPPWEWREGQRKRQPTAATVGAEAS
jgi:endonuclease YncB( thermonuclease family)